MIAEMESLIARITLPKTQAVNENILKEDEVLESSQDENNEEFNDEAVADFNEKENFELA
jgi:hypothetical protein